MRASFDGARKNLAMSFNRLAKTNIGENQRLEMQDLRNSIVALLCMYDPENPKDCNDLIDTVRLEELK